MVAIYDFTYHAKHSKSEQSDFGLRNWAVPCDTCINKALYIAMLSLITFYWMPKATYTWRIL